MKTPWKTIAALALAVLVSACAGFKGSPHGYAVVSSASSTGITAGVSETGMPTVNIGTRSGRIFAAPTLTGPDGADGNVPMGARAPGGAGVGITEDMYSIVANYGADAQADGDGVGANIGDVAGTGFAAVNISKGLACAASGGTADFCTGGVP